MQSLFIIGNGFDLSHGIKTSYENFHQYLKSTYPNACLDGLDIYIPEKIGELDKPVPQSLTELDDEVEYDDVSILIDAINRVEGYKWSDLENSLGVLDLTNITEPFSYIDENGEVCNLGNHTLGYRSYNLSDKLSIDISKVTDYFAEWVNAIKIDSVCPKYDFKKLIDKNDLFLTFNYTKTLDAFYNVTTACHIHVEKGGKLIFGHGNDEVHYKYTWDRHIGVVYPLSQLQAKLRKNTEEAIKKNQKFFNSLSDSINKIYSYGFSFSKVDQVYIKEICKKVSTTKIIWYLNDYDSCEERDKFKDIIRSCGFEGEFDTYNIFQ